MKKTPGSLSRDIFLSVGRSFIFIFVPVAALLIFILMIFHEKEHKNRSALLQNHEKDGVSVIFYQLSSDFRFILSDLNIILEHAELKKITEKGLTEDSKDALALELLAFSRNRKLYDQIRLFHTTGSEVIRVSYNSGSPIIAPEKELESETKNTFILETSHIKRGEINVSPLGINIENKAAGESPEAVISFGAPLFDSRGHKRGIVIFDFKGENLLTHFSNAPAGARGQKMLLNTEGYWLKAPQKEDEWGFVFADRKDRTFGKRYPDSWKKIEENESG